MATARHRSRAAPKRPKGGPTGHTRVVLRPAFRKDDPESQVLKNHESRQISDPFASMYSIGGSGVERTLEPQYSPFTLLKLVNKSNMLRQCIDAMVVNCEGFGHRLEFIGPEGTEESPEADAERVRIEALLDQPNGEYELTELRERVRTDRESIGYGVIEVGRDMQGNVTMLHHVPAHTVRLTARDSLYTEVARMLPRQGKLQEVKTRVRFRRFIQEVGGTKVYFKEFGDPRKISSVTGVEEPNVPFADEATEMVHMPLYAPGEPYGLPRWINQLPTILGVYESELTNLQFFRDNAIPAMAVLVSGGYLTEQALQDLEEVFARASGRESIHRVMVLEAQVDATADSEKQTTPRVELKPLSESRQSDGLFKQYEEAGHLKVRSAFRLGPLFLGRSDDYTRSTAEASMIVADNQVFSPERGKIDSLFNHKILATEGSPPTFWRFRSNPPRITGSDAVIEAMTMFDKLGALSPNIAIGIANELFALNIPRIVDPWGAFPFQVVQSMLARGDIPKGMESVLSDLASSLPEAPAPQPNDAGDEGEPPDEPEAKNAVVSLVKGKVADLQSALGESLDATG